MRWMWVIGMLLAGSLAHADPGRLISQGEAEERKGHWPQALAHYTALEKESGYLGVAKYLQARVEYRRADYVAAQTLVTEALRDSALAEQTRWSAVLLYGQTHLSRGYYQRAKDVFVRTYARQDDRARRALLERLVATCNQHLKLAPRDGLDVTAKPAPPGCPPSRQRPSGGCEKT